MFSSIARNARKGSQHTRTMKSGNSHGVPFQAARYILREQQQQNRAYFRFASHVRKSSNSRTHNLHRFYFSYFRRSLSTTSSSSSSSKNGFLKWYLGMLENRPLIIKSVSSSLLYAAADITAQMITMPPDSSFDSMRTLRIGAYGLLIMGPSQHLWFNFVSRILPRLDLFTTVKKIFMGQAIYGPCMTSIFFTYNAALRGESKDAIMARLKRDLIPTLKSGLMYWPICDFLTFRYVPVHLQPLVNSSFAYLWTIYLTYMACLEKADTN